MDKKKVLIVDDSSVARELLAYIINSEAGLQVVGKAENGEEAVELTEKLKPDVILMDIVMPKKNGFEATKEIMARFPTPIIVVSGVFNKDEVEEALTILEAGAMTIIEKPKGVGDKQYLDTTRFVLDTIKALAAIKMGQKPVSKAMGPSVAPAAILDVPIKAVGIAASVGGPQALLHLLSKLPSGFPVPILITQQMPKGFLEGFLKWLDAAIALNVVIPKQGEQAIAGHVYLAPENKSMKINNKKEIVLEDLPETPSARFPADALFASLAEAFGANGIGILIRGIGTDGLKGIEQLRKSGATVVVEEPGAAMLPDLVGEVVGQDAKAAALDKVSGLLKQVAKMRTTA